MVSTLAFKSQIVGSGRKLHVLTLTPFYPSLQDSASGCFVAEPLSALAHLNVSNSVIAAQPLYRDRCQLSPEAPPANWMRYPAFPGRWGLASAGRFLFARSLPGLRGLHAREPIHLIHAHAALPCGQAAHLLSNQIGIPYLVSVHGLDAYSSEQASGFMAQWREATCRKVYAAATRVICISERVRQHVLQGGRERFATDVVYNGVDPGMFSPTDSVSASAPTIASVGNLISIKGHDLLICAIGRLRNQYPTLRCEIVGSGPEREALERLARDLNLSDCVQFLGRISRQEVAALLRRSTLFALPSRYEGLGCVYLEAMSTGLATIGCREQGIEEVIRHGQNGWLVDPGDLEQLTEGLATLLGNPELCRHIGVLARASILQGLTLERQAARLLEIYRECAA